jgi:hypothetical protein
LTTWLAPALVAVALVAVGCSSSSSSSNTDAGAGTSTSVTSAPVGTTTGTTSTWKVSLTSQDKKLHTVGPNDSRTYGWNQLVGTTALDGKRVEVELLGNVNYTNGSGPWFGFITLTSADGTLGFKVHGDAKVDPSTKDTAFTGSMDVIGGTGAWATTTGSATLTGQRLDALGGQVDFDVTMTLAG